MRRFLFAALLAVGLVVHSAPSPAAEEKLSAEFEATRPVILAAAARIDQLIDADRKKHDVAPSVPANDQVFMRRVYLDITGTIPTGLIVLTSEFGRSPKINERVGRDHYPAAYSSLIAGAGIRGGYAHGASDDRGHFVEDDQVTVEDFNATIAQALGIPTDRIAYSASKRPFKIANDGVPVQAVFA